METQPGKHALFLGHEEAKRHADWLREMKGQFLSRRQELKTVALEYTKVGKWVLPQRKD